MPSLVYLPMNFRIYMSRVHVYGWTSAWIKSPPRTWSSIPASAARLGRSNNEAWSWSVWLFWGRQLSSHDQLVCHPPHTSASTIGMIIQMGMSIRLIRKSQQLHCKKGKVLWLAFHYWRRMVNWSRAQTKHWTRNGLKRLLSGPTLRWITMLCKKLASIGRQIVLKYEI